MKNILEELWYGNICPHEDFGAHGHEIQKRMRENSMRSEEILAGLDEKARVLYEAYIDCIYDQCALSAIDAFTRGYALGVRMILAALAEQ